MAIPVPKIYEENRYGFWVGVCSIIFAIGSFSPLGSYSPSALSVASLMLLVSAILIIIGFWKDNNKYFLATMLVLMAVDALFSPILIGNVIVDFLRFVPALVFFGYTAYLIERLFKDDVLLSKGVRMGVCVVIILGLFSTVLMGAVQFDSSLLPYVFLVFATNSVLSAICIPFNIVKVVKYKKGRTTLVFYILSVMVNIVLALGSLIPVT